MPSATTLTDEAEVLRVCLELVGIGQEQVVHDFTRCGTMGPCDDDGSELIEFLQAGLPGVESSTINDFLEKNRNPGPMPPELTLGGRLIAVSSEVLSQIFHDEDGWTRFRSTYPNSAGTVDFSRVGFNSEGTQAVIYVGAQYDWLMGNGNYYLFLKADGQWRNAASTMAWIS